MSIATILLTVLIIVSVYVLMAFATGNSKGCCHDLSGHENSDGAHSCCGRNKVEKSAKTQKRR